MKEKINAINEYLKYFPNDSCARNNLLICEYADSLGMEIKNGYYPRIEFGYFVINRQIKVGKKYNLTNSKTNYQNNNVDNIIIWSESCGRLAFVSDTYWWAIEDEWNWLMDILKWYNPLDYDEINNTYIYNVENGKKLIADYEDIMRDFHSKITKKIKKIDVENKKKEIARLQKELEEES